MADSEILWVFLIILTLFIVVFGVVVSGYEEQSKQVTDDSDTNYLVTQGAVITLTLMFAAGLIVVMVGVIKAMASHFNDE